MIKKVFYYIYQGLYIIWLAIWFYVMMILLLPFIILPIALFGDKKGGPYSYMALKFWARFFVLSGVWFKYENRPLHLKNKGCVYVANHNSFMDSVIVMPAIPGQFRPLGKKEILKFPVFGWLYPYVVVLVDRKDKDSRYKSMIEMGKMLAQDIPVLLFPEGTMNRTDLPIQDFKDGAFRLAIKYQVPIVPLILEGSRDRIDSRKIAFSPGFVKAKFLQEISTHGLALDDAESIMNRCHKMMYDELA